MQLIFILFFGGMLIQCLFIILFLLAFGKKRSPIDGSEVPISVIVAAHDELDNLKELIPLLLAQEYPSFEVIVVEDRCNDESFDYLREESKRDARLRVVRVASKPDHVNGKKFALTLGIKAAVNDWVLLTDADCRPNSSLWIKEISKRCAENKDFVLGYSPYQKEKGFLNSFIRYESLLTAIQFIGLAILGKPYMGVGRNLAYRKSLFLDSKGFHDHLSVTGGDDDLFVNQHATSSNAEVVFGENSIVTSVPKTTWVEFYVQKVRHLSVGKHYKATDRMLLGLFSISLIASWALLVPVALLFPIVYVVFGVFLIRWVLLSILTHKASRKLGYAFEGWKAPFLDFIFVIYYLVTGLVALQTKKVRWKKT